MKKHNEDIIKAGHDLSGRPITDIIPKEIINNINKKPVRLKHKSRVGDNLYEHRILPEIRSQKQHGNHTNYNAMPSSKNCSS